MEPSSPTRKRPQQGSDFTNIHQPHQSTLSVPIFYALEHLGRGSYATVYKVKHLPTGKIYAVKVLSLFQDVVLNQICAGIHKLRSLHDHPNVVKCHDLVQYDSELQIVLEYMDRGSLKGAHIIHEPSLANIARQILSGLAYLHRCRIAHLDIKPSNLLKNALKQVKISDSVSRVLSEGIHPSNSSAGTYYYNAPELLDFYLGKITDININGYYAADIWSLGVTILELYLGFFPLVNRPGDWEGMLNAICELQPPVAPRTATREFRHFISCCLQKEAKRRLTAAQLLFHPFITGQQLSPLQEQPSSTSSSHGKIKSNL